MDEDDAWTLNTCIAQRKCVIPHSTMKTHCNMPSIVVMVLCNQPEAFTSDLCEDQSRCLLCNGSGQFIHTHAPLSPSSIIYYVSVGGDALCHERL